MSRSLFSGEINLEEALEHILPKQKSYISDPSRFADYTGGFGSGKSVALCASLLLLGKQQPGSLILIGRNTMPDLKDSTRRVFLEMVPETWVDGGMRGWMPSEQRLRMSNGTEYLFRHLDVSDQKNSAHLKALNLTAFGIDEAGEVAEEVFLNLRGRIRRKNTPTRWGRLVGNPNGHDWRWKFFHDPARAQYYRDNYHGYVAPTTDNIHLAEDYVEDLLQYPADWVERYVYGSFADFTDSVYKEWDETIHVWDPKQKWNVFGDLGNPPDHWPLIVGIDIGGVDPWAFSFIRVAPNGMMFKFAEIHQSGILISQLAKLYWELVDKSPLHGLAYDYENQQAAYELGQHNIRGTPAHKEIKPGIFTVASYLHINPTIKHPFRETEGSPMYFVSSDCVNTRQQYATYKWGKNRQGQPTGLPADGQDDHDVDADRYALQTFKPIGLTPIVTREYGPLDTASDMYWHDVKEAEKRAQMKRKPFHSRRKRGILRDRGML